MIGTQCILYAIDQRHLKPTASAALSFFPDRPFFVPHKRDTGPFL